MSDPPLPVLEEYTDLVELGSGGFGTVYRAWHDERILHRDLKPDNVLSDR